MANIDDVLTVLKNLTNAVYGVVIAINNKSGTTSVNLKAYTVVQKTGSYRVVTVVNNSSGTVRIYDNPPSGPVLLYQTPGAVGIYQPNIITTNGLAIDPQLPPSASIGATITYS
jgi:hypothetical protein